MTSLFEAERDLQATLQAVADIAVPDFADYVTVDLLLPDGALERVAVASDARTEWSEALIAETRTGIRRVAISELNSPLRLAIAEQRGILVPLLSDEMLVRAAYSPRHLELARAASPTSLIFSPLVVRGVALGAMQFCAYRGSRTYDEDALTIANDVAQRAAFAIDNARLRADYEREIAERRAAEETRRASDALLRTIVDATPDLIFARDRAGQHILVNRAGAIAANLSVEEIQARDAIAVFGPELGARIVRDDAETFATGQGIAYETTYHTAQGPREYSVVKRPLLDDDDTTFGIVSVSRDITEQRRAQEQLVAREQRISLILDSAPVGMMLLRREPDGEYRLAEVNAFFEELTGLTREVIAERTIASCFPERMLAETRTCVELAEARRARTDPRVYRVALPAGTRTIESIATPIIGGDGEITHVLIAAHDVGDREAARRAVAESERRYRVLFDSSPVPMWVYDPDSLRFMEVNQAAVEVYGWTRDEFHGMTMLDIRSPDDADSYRQRLKAIDAGGVLLTPSRHRKRDGTVIDVEVYGADIIFDGRRARLVYAADVTAQRRLTEQLLQAQKTEAVGRLAGGIAHDFNNILTVITGFARLAQARVAEGQRVSDELEQVVRAGDRAASLTRQLLAYSRRQLLQPQRLDLNDIVREVALLLRRTIGEDVTIQLQLSGSELSVFVDPAQLHTVLVNLALNARDAMPTGGTLVISSSLERRVTGEGTVRFVALSVRDTGKGMDAATRARLFEPFFTTKEVGQGTGLGLATVYGIVTQSGGSIEVQSTLGEGTTFTVLLPEATAPDAAVPHENTVVAHPPAPASGIVLLAEDDAGVRTLTTRFLREAGYEVHAAGSAEQALDMARALPQIDILVADVIMPGLSGRALAEQLRADRPSLRILFVSGYTADIVARHGVLEEGLTLLEKPFTAAELLSALHSLSPRAPG